MMKTAGQSLEYRCLVRETDGKKRISTSITGGTNKSISQQNRGNSVNSKGDSNRTHHRFSNEGGAMAAVEVAAKTTMYRLSGMQKQVLSLYRGFLRVARCKPQQDRSRIESIVTSEFRRNAVQIDRKNFLYIEYLLRRGRKQLDQLKSPDTTGLSSIDVDPSSRTLD